MDCFVIDDELCVAQSICEYFELFEMTCGYAVSYEEGLQFLKENDVSVLLLDINLGHESGFALCKEIRKSFDMPILFISATNSDSDILTAIGVGGDDLIAKPFSLAVLYAKVGAILKRYKDREGKANARKEEKNVEQLGNVLIDIDKVKIERNGSEVKLKPMEWKLLLYLLQNSERVISKQELLDEVWEDTFIGEGTLSVHIRHLREKLEDNPNKPELLKTVWGIGYIMERKA